MSVLSMVKVAFDVVSANVLVLGGVYVGYRFSAQVGAVLAAVEKAGASVWALIKKA